MKLKACLKPSARLRSPSSSQPWQMNALAMGCSRPCPSPTQALHANMAAMEGVWKTTGIMPPTKMTARANSAMRFLCT